MSALESLKDATAKALVEAIENKNVAMVKQLFTIYYEVQQIEDPGQQIEDPDNQFTLSFEGSGTEWGGIESKYSDDMITSL